MATDQATLEALNREYIRSVSEADVRWFDANLSEDFVNSNPDCSLVDRAGFSPDRTRVDRENLDIEDVLIRVLGDVALIHATAAPLGGRAAGGGATRTWARRGATGCVAATSPGSEARARRLTSSPRRSPRACRDVEASRRSEEASRPER